MTILDSQQKIKEIDQSQMAELIAELPKSFVKSQQESEKIEIPLDYKNINNIVFCGMGGSGIGGELIKNIIFQQCQKPIIIIRGKEIPQSVNKNSLVFLISSSGQTKETISCFNQALKRKAKLFVITQGGELEKLSKKNKVPLFKFKYSAPPRACLPFLLIPVLSILNKLTIIDSNKYQIKDSFKYSSEFNKLLLPKVETEKNIAKHLAYFIYDHLPIIIAPNTLSGTARRWKTQLAENSKNFSFFELQPEIFHNFIESEKPWRLKDEFVFIFLPLTKEKGVSVESIRKFKKILDKKEINWEQIPDFGENIFKKTISLILLGDWISFYLAILNQTDPTPVQKIKEIKSN